MKNKDNNENSKIDDKIINMSEVREHLKEKIYQTNPLIQARKQMGAIELKIFILGLQGVNPHISTKDKYYDDKFWITHISPATLSEIFGHTQYLTEIEKACKNLIKTYIEIKEGSHGFTLFNVFYRLRYIHDKGLYIQFHEDLRPYILDIYKSKGYTQYSVEQVFKLSSAHAIRLCELLLQFQGTKQSIIMRTIGIEDLKFALNIPEGSYDRMDNLKKRVLDDPIREINKTTDYVMWYEQIKKGHNIVAFKFYMDISKVREAEQQAKDKKQEFIPFYQTEVARRLGELGFKYEASKAILAKCDNGRDLIERLEFALKMYEKNKFAVKNKQGYIRKGIVENWLASYLQDQKERGEAREIWRQTKINNTSVQEEAMKHFAENIQKETENEGVKRLLRPDEIRMIQMAHATRNAREVEKAFALLSELNWTWNGFKDFYGL